MEKQKFYLVAADALPEVFLRVAEAKRMLQVGEAATVGDAARQVGTKDSPFRLAFALSRLYQPLPLSAQDIRKQQRIKDSSVAPFDGANYKC